MKSKIFMGIFLIIILMANVSFASYSTVTMTVVEEPICTIKFGENSKFEKKLFSKDLANKEVTLQLQVTNEEISDKPTGEIMLVLDNSASMSDEVSNGATRQDLIYESAKTLVSALLKDNTQLKIGIVRFSTNADLNKEGTIEDASLVSQLTDNATELTDAISTIKADGDRTDLDAGLKLASQQFSNEDNNKYMIILTDGVPNVAVDYDGFAYSDDATQKTNQELKTLDQKGIKIITMLTEVDENSVPIDKTKGEILKEVFGSPEKPTAGKFYYVADSDIEQTITNTIYNDLLPIEKILKDITIVDYFPEEIIKNFDFAYVSNADIGNISSVVDTSNNSITWTIPELTSGQTATVQYKLKLKQDFDSAIIDKILNTNKKVDINYIDFDDVKQEKTSDISPKLKLTEPPVILPKAGTITLIGLSVLVIGLFVFSIIKLTILHKHTH